MTFIQLPIKGVAVLLFLPGSEAFWIVNAVASILFSADTTTELLQFNPSTPRAPPSVYATFRPPQCLLVAIPPFACSTVNRTNGSGPCAQPFRICCWLSFTEVVLSKVQGLTIALGRFSVGVTSLVRCFVVWFDLAQGPQAHEPGSVGTLRETSDLVHTA